MFIIGFLSGMLLVGIAAAIFIHKLLTRVKSLIGSYPFSNCLTKEAVDLLNRLEQLKCDGYLTLWNVNQILNKWWIAKQNMYNATSKPTRAA